MRTPSEKHIGSPLNFSGALTLTLLTWRNGWAPNNASKWQMGFHLVFKGLSKKPEAQRPINDSQIHKVCVGKAVRKWKT